MMKLDFREGWAKSHIDRHVLNITVWICD